MLEQNINSDLIRGHIDTIILKILRDGDNYGYEIMKAVSMNSNNEYELKEPSLYTSLKRLEKQGHIVSYWGDQSQGGRRKYYQSRTAVMPFMKKHFRNGYTQKKLLLCFCKEVRTNDRFTKIC